MKDPLRYYISEGLMAIWACPNLVPGKFRAMYHTSPLVAHNVEVKEIGGANHLIVEKVAYRVDKNFFLDYAIMVKNELEATALAKLWLREFNENAEVFKSIRKELEPVA